MLVTKGHLTVQKSAGGGAILTVRIAPIFEPFLTLIFCVETVHVLDWFL